MILPKKSVFLSLTTIIVFGIVGSVALYFIAQRMETLQIKQNIYQESEKTFQEIKASLNQSLSVLEAIKIYYLSSVNITREEFKTYTGFFLKKSNNILALEWAPLVESNEKNDYELKMQQESFSEFQITERDPQGAIIPAANRKEYFPVQFVEPYEDNKEVLGLDVASDGTRFNTLMKSRNNGRPFSTEPITLFRKPEVGKHFFVFNPVFINKDDPSELSRNEDNFAGFVVGVFNLGQTFEAVQRDLAVKRLNLTILDESVKEPIYTTFVNQEQIEKSNEFRVEETIFFAGRSWRLILQPTHHYISFRKSNHPILFLMIGILMTTIFAINFNLKLVEKRHNDLVLIQNEELKHLTNVAERVKKDAVEYADRLEKALKETQFTKAELERSNKDLEEFAYVASHDLQEPLRMISGFTQLLEKKYKDQLDATAIEYIHFANDGAMRMQTLVEALLQYSRVGKKDASYDKVDLNDVINLVLADLDFLIKESDAQIKVGQLPVLFANRAQMVQLFQNLVSNALKFREHGRSVEIEVACERKNDFWQFSVKDNGIGIDPKFSDRIFVIFQRLHPHKKYPGTGIGLSLCKKIVENYKGRIWLVSEPGKGCVFYFTMAQN